MKFSVSVFVHFASNVLVLTRAVFWQSLVAHLVLNISIGN